MTTTIQESSLTKSRRDAFYLRYDTMEDLTLKLLLDNDDLPLNARNAAAEIVSQRAEARVGRDVKMEEIDERPMTIGTVADLEEAIKRHPYMTLHDRFEFRLQNVANLLSDETSKAHDHAAVLRTSKARRYA